MADATDLGRRFLLGDLSSAEMDTVGARLVTDDVFSDEVADAEDRLIADYLTNVLPASDRAAFERVYLASPVHRARVETVRGLNMRAHQGTVRVQARGAGVGRWLPAAAAVLLCGLGAWWFVSRGTVVPGSSTPSSVDSAAEGPAPTPAAPGTAPPSAPPVAAATSAPVVALTLTPLVTRGGGEQATAVVPRGTAQVRLLAGGDLPPADALTAEIAAVDRDDVRRWPVDDAPAGTGASRAVTVPVYAVPEGDYILTLWQGDAEIVQRYAFRIAPR